MRRERRGDPEEKKRPCCLYGIIGVLILALIVGVFFFTFRSEFNKVISFITKQNQTPSTTNVIANNFSINGKIYFIKNKNIWVASGSSIKQLTTNSSVDQISVSTDSKSIIYSRIDTNYANLYRFNIATGVSTQLTFTKLFANLYNSLWYVDPILSPLGDKVAFVSDKGKTISGNSDLSVFEMNLLTKSVTQISHSYPYTGGDQDAIYYPLDENYILYTKYTYLNGDQQPFSKLYMMDIRNQQSYTLSPDEEGILAPAFTHDGKFLFFLKRDTTDIALNKNNSLYIMPFHIANIEDPNPDTAFLKDFQSKIFLRDGENAMPVVSPDDKQIAFITESNNDYNLATDNLAESADKLGNTIFKLTNEQFITQESALTTTSRIAWTQ